MCVHHIFCVGHRIHINSRQRKLQNRRAARLIAALHAFLSLRKRWYERTHAGYLLVQPNKHSPRALLLDVQCAIHICWSTEICATPTGRKIYMRVQRLIPREERATNNDNMFRLKRKLDTMDEWSDRPRVETLSFSPKLVWILFVWP